MRKAGDVIYTNTTKDGDGVVEFANREDMEHAIRTMDDTQFNNRGDSTYIRVKAMKKNGGGSGGGGKQQDDENSRGRSNSNDRDRSRDRRRSPSRSAEHGRDEPKDADRMEN
jgi:RNA recognition motif-containing protein